MSEFLTVAAKHCRQAEHSPQLAAGSFKWLVLIILVFLELWAASPVASEPQRTEAKEQTEPGSPIHITSDAVTSHHGMGWVEFTGNVTATQQDTVVTADRIKIFYRSDGDATGGAARIEKVVSHGNVEIVFDNKTRRAVAEKAVYNADQKVLVLSGDDATVWSGENVIRGKKITLLQDENGNLVEGGVEGPVKATFYTAGEEGLMK
ncbi:MAG: hypothetical protein HWN68_12300 [Desulfobacterales bacterium]|nr:hypothetical protein [Desulfobacterales bacterium]